MQLHGIAEGYAGQSKDGEKKRLATETVAVQLKDKTTMISMDMDTETETKMDTTGIDTIKTEITGAKAATRRIPPTKIMRTTVAMALFATTIEAVVTIEAIINQTTGAITAI